MVLLIAVGLGFIAALIRALVRQEKLGTVQFKAVWLVFLAFLPQYLAFSLPSTRTRIPDSWIPAILLGSQTLLIVFVVINRKKPGMGLMGIGLVLNFVVIALNHGFMPLSPATAQQLIPAGVSVNLTLGERVEYGKDILLLPEETRMGFLSDIFLLPHWFQNYRAAFSIGDLILSCGAFWYLWSLGGPAPIHTAEVEHAQNL